MASRQELEDDVALELEESQSRLLEEITKLMEQGATEENLYRLGFLLDEVFWDLKESLVHILFHMRSPEPPSPVGGGPS